MDIWAECNGLDAIVPISGALIRVVESQEQVATNALVDSLDEQALLEELLETSKPASMAGDGMHYLLTTPFRYPPLRHGSRFGGKQEPSLFYGGQDLTAALAETAYYRFVFWSGMVVPPQGGKLTTELTVFGVNYETQMGVLLHAPPFDRFASELIHPEDYKDTQQLGAQMRGSGVQAFEYPSARDPGRGIDVALFTPIAFVSKRPEWQQSSICETRADKVSFYSNESGALSFGLDRFLVNDHLPTPAV